MVDLQHIKKIKEENEAKILLDPNVRSVGVGLLSDKNGKLMDEVGIIVRYYKNSLAESILPEKINDVIVQTLFTTSENITVRNQLVKSHSVTKENLNATRRDKFNVMVGGISGSPDFFYINAIEGTIGAVLRKRGSGLPVILSNRHVIAGKNPKIGDGVSQPAREFTGDLAASLMNWFEGNTKEGFGMDAAIADPTNGRTAQVGHIFGIKDVPVGFLAPELKMLVEKSGLTTGNTRGVIVEVETVVRDTKDKVLYRQFLVEDPDGIFCSSGDSGSVVLTTNAAGLHIVGLLWGADEEYATTVASPIEPVLNYFGCDVI